jgi:hypothetical protein
MSVLPAGFEDLAALVGEWSLPDERSRYAKRLATPLPELRRFHEAMHPRMDAVLRHLACIPVARGTEAAPADRHLFYLALAYFEASHPIDLHWKGPDLDVAFPAERIAYVGPSSRAD